jgi:hypothetical protein
MAGPQDWGAVAVAEPDNGPAAWGAQPAPEQANTNPAFQPSGNRSFTPLIELPDDVHGLTYSQAAMFVPVQIYRGLRDMFFAPGKVAQGGQMTPEQEIEFAGNVALTIVGGSEIARPGGIAKAIGPAVKEFQESVIAPGLQKVAAEARPPANTPEGVMAQPEVRDAIANGPVNRDNHVPYEAGASAGPDATTNIDKSIPEIAKLPSGASFDTATPLKIHEQVEKFVMDKLIAGGMDDAAAYRVGHWEYAEPAEDAWYAAQGIDPREAEAWWTERAAKIEHEPTDDTPPNLYDKPYPHDSVSLANEGPPGTPKPSPDEIAQAQQILGKTGEQFGGGLADFFKARDLGVIGDEPPRLSDGSPKEAAARAIPAQRTGDDVLHGPEPGAPETDPWKARFEQFVGNLNAPDDIKDLIRNAARDNGDFVEARTGEIPLRQVEQIEQAAGVAPGTIDRRGLGRLLKNDNEVRLAMHGMLQATENVKAAARDVRADASPENLIALQEAIARRDMAVEGVVGLRAEWGRTGNVFQEFLQNVKDEKALSDFLRERGRTTGDLRDLADAIDMSDRDTAARVLEKYKRTPPGWLYYTWVNGLISGVLTHTKYIAANALYLASERGLVTPLASILGKAKEIAGVDMERTMFGETAAGMYGMLAATPHAIVAAGRSVLFGERMALRSEAMLRDALKEKGEAVPPGMERRVTELQPLRPTNDLLGVIPADSALGRVVSRIVGLPGDAANGIHLAFKILNERAALESLAYRQTIKDGFAPTDPDFWAKRAERAANPSEDTLRDAVHDAYKGTFMQELGPLGKQFSGFMQKFWLGRVLFPFRHIPLNLLRATYEHTPAALASVLREDSEIGAALRGEKGGVEQDKAVARVMVGSAVMGYFMHLYLNGQATGDLPYDPKERQKFYMSGKQPNSILIGDHWVSYARFGPAGDLAALGANFGTVAEAARSGDVDAVEKAAAHAALSGIRLLSDEVGFMSLQFLFEALTDPDRKGPQVVASEASSLMPFSSALGQGASYGDPNMRQAKTILDGIKYRIPGERETLLPKRDWNGRPIANPQFHNILRQGPATPNPIDAELVRLGVTPAPVQARIGAVKLTPALQDEYAATAGPLVDRLLSATMQQPGFRALPKGVQAETARKMIAAGRAQARQAMMAHHPELVQQGVAAREAAILGQ